MNPNQTQIAITKTVINAMLIFSEVEIIEQRLEKHGRSGALYITKIHIPNYNPIENEVGYFLLEVMKNGKTTLYQYQDSSLCLAKNINI